MNNSAQHQARIARRVHAEAIALSALSAAAGLTALAYLLDMTAMEAERVLREAGEPE